MTTISPKATPIQVPTEDVSSGLVAGPALTFLVPSIVLSLAMMSSTGLGLLQEGSTPDQ